MKRMYRSLPALGFALLLSACATPDTPAVDADAKSSASRVAHGRAAAGQATANGSSAKAAERPAADVAANAPAPAAPAVVDPQVKAEHLLSEGTELYDRGDYKGAIRKLLLARDTAASASLTRQNSLKYLAFSYCVTGQKPPCKAQFATLLKIAPEFQLTRAEAGHPLWGPVFKEARLEVPVNVAARAKPKK